MRAGVAMLVQGAGGGGGGAPIGWNPADKSSNLTLSNSNKRATRAAGTGWASARGHTSKSTGKWYFEIALITIASGGDTDAGLDTGSSGLDSYVGSGAGGYGYLSINGQKVNNNSFTGFGSTWTAGDVIGVAYDADAGKMWFAKNNTWQASGDPATGANPAYSGVPSGMYQMGGVLYGGIVIDLHSATADLTYSPPIGFSAWD